MQTTPISDESDRPFVSPSRELDWGAPTRWLALGWKDLRRAPALSLLFGGVVALVSVGVSWLAWELGRFALLATLLSGFVFIAPLLAVSLYCVSRQLEREQLPRLGECCGLARRVIGQAGVFALGQMVILLLWSRAGMMITVFIPPAPGDLLGLLEYLLIGSVVGAIFASFTFATAAFSLPMIADRDVDMVTAGVSSVNAVLRNKSVMLWWAFLIVLLTVVGFATAFIGLIVIMPWLAYASWHAYRETLDASAWPTME